MNELRPQVSQLFLIVHMLPGGGLSAEARKASVSLTPVWSGVAIVGGNGIQRAAMNVVFRALSLLSAKQPPSRLVASIEEAHAFVDGLRSSSHALAANG